MKKIFIILLIAISFVFFSCNKETPSAKSDTAATTTLAINTTKFADPGPTIFSSCDKWVITDFSVSGTDYTGDYSSSSLIFCPDHTFTISNDVMTKNGQWSFVNIGALGTLGFQVTFNDDNIPLDAWVNLQGTWNVKFHDSSALGLQSSDGKKEMMITKLTR
ncbi:MAG: hypothetical protein QM737_23290 [Ferruginibacter sp.]